MKKFFNTIVFIFFILFLVSCGKTGTIPQNDMPDIGIPAEEMNLRLQIISPKGYQNTLKNNDDLALVVSVISDDNVAFKPDFGARIFIYQDNQWVELKNKMDYSVDMSLDRILSPYKKDPLQQATIVMVPFKQGLNKTVPMRVILIGNLVKNNQPSEIKTAGYIDLELNP